MKRFFAIVFFCLTLPCLAGDDASMQYLQQYYGLIYPFGPTLGGDTIFGYGSYNSLNGVNQSGSIFGVGSHFSSIGALSIGTQNADLGDGNEFNSGAFGRTITVSLPSTFYFGGASVPVNDIFTLPSSGWSNFVGSVNGTNVTFNTAGYTVSGVPINGNGSGLTNGTMPLVAGLQVMAGQDQAIGLSTGSTKYLLPSGPSTAFLSSDTNASLFLPGIHCLSNLWCYVSALSAGTNIGVTIRANGTNTGITNWMTSAALTNLDSTHVVWLTNAVIDIQESYPGAQAGLSPLVNWSFNY